MTETSLIKDIKSRRVFDSRGNPSVEVDIITTNNVIGRAISPSGASTGKNEALELRDKDNMFGGKDIKNALKLINTSLKPLLIGNSCLDQKQFDKILLDFDNSFNKENIGGNVTTALSIANYLCASRFLNVPLYKMERKNKIYKLPKTEIQIFGGGAHAGNNKSFQDFLIYPNSEFSYEDFYNATYNILKWIRKDLEKKNNFFGYCDEGGIFPNLINHFQICEIINEAILKNHYIPGKDICISIDVAANNIFNDNFYNLLNKKFDVDELENIYLDLVDNYNVKLLEDPFEEGDFKSFSKLKKNLKNKCKLIGDDLICTNYSLLKNSLKKNLIDGIIIKINQCGTITETKKVIQLAKKNNIKTILSARSGDSEDNYLSHLAINWDVDMIKVGSFSRSERMAKWNELIRIVEIL